MDIFNIDIENQINENKEDNTSSYSILLNNSIITPQQIKIISDLLNDIQVYIHIHDESSLYFNKYNNLITIPSIVLSIVSGAISTLFGSKDDDDKESKNEHLYNVILGITMILAGCLTALGRFLKFELKYQDHFNLSSDFYSLKYEIREYLSKPDDLKDNATLFVSNIIIKHCNLIKTNVEIPDKIYLKYSKKLAKDIELEYSPKQNKQILKDTINNDINRESVDSDTMLQKKYFKAMERNLDGLYLKKFKYAKKNLEFSNSVRNL